MDKYVVVSYALSLMLLFINILCFHIAFIKRNRSKLLQWIIRLIGVIPGFIGVLLGIYIFIKTNGEPKGIAIMSAFLLLELGSVQLLNILKKLEKSSEKI